MLVARHENEISGTTDVAGAPGVREPQDDQDHRRSPDHRLVHGGLHPGRAEDAARQGAPALGAAREHGVRRPVRDPDPRGGAPARAARGAPYGPHASGSRRRPSTRRTSTRSASRSRSRCCARSTDSAWTPSATRSSSSRSRSATCSQLDKLTRLPLEQLVDATGAPYDQVAAGSPTTYADLVTPRGLRAISRYADWVGPNKELVLPREPGTGATGAPSAVVGDAHRVGLKVVVFTIRNENQFMATNFRIGTDPNADGDVHAEITAFLDAGVDGFFADYTDAAVAARDDWSGASRRAAASRPRTAPARRSRRRRRGRRPRRSPSRGGPRGRGGSGGPATSDRTR